MKPRDSTSDLRHLLPHFAGAGVLLTAVSAFWLHFYFWYWTFAIALGAVNFAITWLGHRHHKNFFWILFLLNIFALPYRKAFLPHNPPYYFVYSIQFIGLFMFSSFGLITLFRNKLQKADQRT